MNSASSMPQVFPLYGPPPYQYLGNRTLGLTYETDAESLGRVVGPDLQAVGSVVSVGMVECPRVEGLGPHNFTNFSTAVRLPDGRVAQYVFLTPASTDGALCAYREVQGWPAILAESRIEERGEVIHGVIERGGSRLIDVVVRPGGRRRSIDGRYLSLLRRQAPAYDGRAGPVQWVLGVSLITNTDIREGAAEIEIISRSDLPALPPVRRVIGGSFGTADDLYPESIELIDL